MLHNPDLDCALLQGAAPRPRRSARACRPAPGTWVSVGPLRAAALVEGAPHVQDVVITGHDRDEVGLLIFPRLESCRALAGLGRDADPRTIVESQLVRVFFAGMLERLCAQATGASTRVARALILADPPSIDLGEVTDKVRSTSASCWPIGPPRSRLCTAAARTCRLPASGP